MGRITNKIIPNNGEPYPKDSMIITFSIRKDNFSFEVRMRDKLPKMMNECRFLAAAKQSIEKSTFHALPWSIEKIGWIPKVHSCVCKYFSIK